MASTTRERILETSLALFNDRGEPAISTNHIAGAMDISPGNLYYHFRNKDEIVLLLYQRFHAAMDRVLVVPERRPPDMEDMWLYVHLVYETIWQYRFLYRDLNNLLARNRSLARRFRRILERKERTAAQIFQGLTQDGLMSASEEEIQALATNITLVATFWLNFATARAPAGAEPHLGQGVYQVMALVAPYLQEPARAHLLELSRRYLD